MSANKDRISSIEILRIISMIMVIAYHWQLHGNHDGIMYSSLSSKQIFTFAFGSWGSLGVDIFFIISSFFLIRSNDVKLKRLIPIIIKVSLYGTVVLTVANLCGITDFKIMETIKSILGVFAYQYWFLTVYVVIYCLHPMFNIIVEKLSKSYYLFALSVMMFSTFILGFVFINQFIGRLACGVTIYFIVGFLERFPESNLLKRYNYLISVWGGIAIVSLECLLSYMGMQYSATFSSMINRIQTTQSPLMAIVGLGIFYCTLELNIKQSKTINFLGKYSAGAYLLHGGSSFIKGYLWDGVFKVDWYYTNANLAFYVLHYIACIIGLFIIGVIIEFFVDKTVKHLTDNIMHFKTIEQLQSAIQDI